MRERRPTGRCLTWHHVSPVCQTSVASTSRPHATTLDQLFDAPRPYLLWVHQRPTDGREWPNAHLHVHIAPVLRQPGIMRHVAAGELGSGVWFDPVAPEDAAASLRALPGDER